MGGTPPAHRSPAAITPAASLRQLIDSLNREQRRNQELLASLGFALRSFTNLSRFLSWCRCSRPAWWKPKVPCCSPSAVMAVSGASSCIVRPSSAA